MYNADVLNSSARVATIINEQVVDRIKAFKFPAQESGIDGLKFATVIIYRNLQTPIQFVLTAVAQLSALQLSGLG